MSDAFCNIFCAFAIGLAGGAVMLGLGLCLGCIMYYITDKIGFRIMIKKARKEAIAYIYHGEQAVPIDHKIDRFINNANLPNQASMSDEEKANLEKQINNGKWDVLFGYLYQHFKLNRL